jgi:hypothetical protein
MAKSKWWKPVGIAILAISAAGCGHSAAEGQGSAAQSTSTTSRSISTPTLPAPSNASAVADFLRSTGSSILAFETATKPLDSGTPTRATCVKVAGQLSSTNDASNLLTIVKQVPDSDLNFHLSADIQDKVELLSACLNGHPSPKTVALVRQNSQTVNRLLAQLGL